MFLKREAIINIILSPTTTIDHVVQEVWCKLIDDDDDDDNDDDDDDVLKLTRVTNS